MLTSPFQPMLAAPFKAAQKKGVVTNWAEWVAQVKYDGWRLILEVALSRHGVEVTGWQRPDGDGVMLQCELLTDEIIAACEWLPVGVYDGELLVDLPDTVGTDVPKKANASKRYLMLFDVLRLDGRDLVGDTYDERRMMLEDATVYARGSKVRVAPVTVLKSEADLVTFVEKVWKVGGEGAILKRRAAPYAAGRRTTDFIKVKRVSHAVLELVGFEKSEGSVRFPGHPFAVLKLRDEEGNETTCKTKDDAMLGALEDEFERSYPLRTTLPVTLAKRVDEQKRIAGFKWPFQGRRVMIEFPKRTRTGGYQGPVLFDRWAEEGE